MLTMLLKEKLCCFMLTTLIFLLCAYVLLSGVGEIHIRLKGYVDGSATGQSGEAEAAFIPFNKCQNPNYGGTRRRNQFKSTCPKTDPDDVKTILLWTRYYGRRIWWKLNDKMGTNMFQSPHCRCHNCVLSADRSKLKEADVLLFHYTEGPDWPEEKREGQLYAHFIHEPPRSGGFLKQKKYDEKIDIAINYRFDTDLYAAYNTIVWSEEDREEYIPRIPLEQKTKSIVWPVSHCKAASKRDDYVKELQKYIDVDIFGHCGTKRCPRSNTHGCYRQWEKNYKFYLSFENNICVDYITEKMFSPLKYELIPIVLGGGNYTRDAPPHSVINVRDFPSPEKLAHFLNFLSRNETEYFKYFQWKSDYDFVPMPEWVMCKLCEGLHTDYFHKLPERLPYSKRWAGDNGEYCDNQLVTRMRKSGNW